jgi:hypothetical protein
MNESGKRSLWEDSLARRYRPMPRIEDESIDAYEYDRVERTTHPNKIVNIEGKLSLIDDGSRFLKIFVGLEILFILLN